MILHAGGIEKPASSPITLTIAVIEPTFRAHPMAAARTAQARRTRLRGTSGAAVDVAPVAVSADGEDGLAAWASGQPRWLLRTVHDRSSDATRKTPLLGERLLLKYDGLEGVPGTGVVPLVWGLAHWGAIGRNAEDAASFSCLRANINSSYYYSAMSSASSKISPRVIPVRNRVHRKETTRGVRTRAHVLATAAATIREEGFAKATSNRIAERAGVTWGVIQYHFGDRAGLFWAVLEDAFFQLREGFAALEAEGNTVAERVASVLDQAFACFQTPKSRASMEVLANMRFERGPDHPERRRVNAMQREVSRLGHDALARAIGETARAETIQSLVWMSIRGWSLSQMQGRRFDHTRERAAVLEFIELSLDPSPPGRRSRSR